MKKDSKEYEDKQCFDDRIVPLNVLSVWINVSQRWLREQAEAGRLPALRVKRGWPFRHDTFLFRLDVVMRILKEHLQERNGRLTLQVPSQDAKNSDTRTVD